MKFQIGSNKFRDIYSPTDYQLNDATVYKCRRGHQEGSDNVLWLARTKKGRWVAREAHKDSTDPLRQGKKIFMTHHPIDDNTNPGDIEWMWYDTRGDTDIWKDFEYTFRTTRVEE